MSSFFSKRRHERSESRLSDLDLRICDARESLLYEQARGAVVNWHKNFKALDRAAKDRPNCDELTYAFYLTDYLTDACSYEKAHLHASRELAAVIIPLEDKLREYILAVAARAGFHGGDQSDAIAYLTRVNQLSFIISFINDLEATLQLEGGDL